ncbi:hypothetical protein [uncultured Stenotrophomonas sp.]|uniref:hypothetical protein n=1 Tax=uncultured Stenotrophomonas sp. TaxID=165438 RepID=UPI0028D34824|nr:hypothetical protein [uncultured Stenotrophomonas sp.]
MWARALAGLLAGFFVAAAAAGLITWVPSGPWQAVIVPSMVAFIPLWMLAALWAFSFRTGLRAWLWLGATAASGFGLLWLLRHFDWVQ